MRIKGLIVLAGAAALLLSSCSQNNITGAKMKTREDSLSYAFGIVNYNALRTDSLKLDARLVAKAMLDGENDKAEMSDEIARGFIMQFVTERQAKQEAQQEEQNKILYKDYIAENEAFLTKNREKSGVTVTPSGLQYEVVKLGKGPKPTAENVVKVHYTGTLIDGTEFDSSVKRGEPAEFPVGGVIPGWTEALQLMPLGSIFKLYIPSELAYGKDQAGAVIKPYSTLIFDVELLEIVQ